jgi:hypothetical protein
MFVTDTSERNYSLTGGRFARTAHAEHSASKLVYEFALSP